MYFDEDSTSYPRQNSVIKMCELTRIPQTRTNVSFMLQNLSQWEKKATPSWNFSHQLPWESDASRPNGGLIKAPLKPLSSILMRVRGVWLTWYREVPGTLQDGQVIVVEIWRRRGARGGWIDAQANVIPFLDKFLNKNYKFVFNFPSIIWPNEI